MMLKSKSQKFKKLLSTSDASFEYFSNFFTAAALMKISKLMLVRMFITVRYFRRNYLELFCNKLFLKVSENLLGTLAVVSKFCNFTKKGCILKCFTKNCNIFFGTTILYKTPVINYICDSVQGYLNLVCCSTKKPTDRKECIL